MGSDIAQRAEWNHEESLHWNLLKDPFHSGMQLWVRDINRVYFEEKALHEKDFSSEGFQWIDCSDSKASVLGFIRRDGEEGKVLAVFNFTPVTFSPQLPVGMFLKRLLARIANSDGNYVEERRRDIMGGKKRMEEPLQRQPCLSVRLTLPSLAPLFSKKRDRTMKIRLCARSFFIKPPKEKIRGIGDVEPSGISKLPGMME